MTKTIQQLEVAIKHADREQKRAEQEFKERQKRVAATQEADKVLRALLRDAEKTLRQGADICQRVARQTPRDELQEKRRAEEGLRQLKRALSCLAEIRYLTIPSQMDPELMADNDRVSQRIAKKKTIWQAELAAKVKEAGVAVPKPLFQTLLEQG